MWRHACIQGILVESSDGFNGGGLFALEFFDFSWKLSAALVNANPSIVPSGFGGSRNSLLHSSDGLHIDFGPLHSVAWRMSLLILGGGTGNSSQRISFKFVVHSL